MATVFAGFEVADDLQATPEWRLCHARRVADGSPVLLKLLQPDDAAPEAVARFRREYELLRRLDVPGIAKPLALEREQDRLAMVFEEVPGRSLDAMLAAGTLDLPVALAIASALANTLAGLHAAGLVHTDLRPPHILVAPDGSVCLVDCARATNPARAMPLAAPMQGTEGDEAYLAPEQTGRVNRGIDERTDLHALGVMLRRMLGGELPAPVNDVVTRLLDEWPERRYQSARGLHADLKHCLAQWTRHGSVAPFVLGSHDVCERLRIPQALYGRERELALLREAFDRVATSGRPELVLVSGPSGIGKTSLAHELRPRVAAAHGEFMAAEFGPSQRDIELPQRAGSPSTAPGPLVLFLDELQWAGDNSLAALQDMITSNGPRSLLVVGAFRNTEVDAGHPLMAMLARARQRGAAVSDIVLDTLSREDLGAFIADAVPCQHEALEPLVDLVHEKTGGNPLAAVRFLVALHDERLIEFDAGRGAWRWNAELMRAMREHDDPIRWGAETARSSTVQLDTRSVLKATQAISSEILLDRLLKAIVSTMIDNAGARRGLLFLMRDGELDLAAEGHVEGERIEVSLQTLPRDADVPASILDAARQRRQPVVLADAGAAHGFSGDEYLRRHAPKSVLCLPILRIGELSGLLYLENELIANAFTPQRLEVLELLASQAAISLENARLYADLKLENWQAEAELLDREAHVRRLVDSNIIGVFFWTLNGEILDANDAFLQITGYTRADLEEGAIDWAAMTPPEYAAADRRALQELRQSGTASQYEKEYITRDGRRVPVLIGGALLEDSRDMGIAFVLDLTERQRAAAELQARQAADAANEAKSQFLANMSHELRTPLNAILGYAQLLSSDQGRDERTVAGLDTIRQSGELLLTLINDILDVAAIESGKMALSPEPVNLLPFLNAVTDIVRVKADQKNLLLTLNAAAGLPPIVRMDEKRLRQVLLNLLSNAVKFTAAGEVQLRVYPLGLPVGATVRLRFEVKDSGMGIGTEQLGAIFEPFVQAPDVQRRFGGTGLGLSISRQLLALMGSEIQVDSRVSQGSCFRFDLELPAETDTVGEAPAAPRRRFTGYAGPRRRVLVVDDIATNRMTLLDLLKPLGFEVIEAESGEAGVAQAELLHPDLVLMDAVMPVMDGLDATRRLRALPQTRGLPIIIVSAGAGTAAQQNALEAGADAFLPKPLDMQRLLVEIGNLLQLTWLPLAGDSADVAALPLHAPPAEELEVLYQLAKTGNMRRIREQAEQLAKLSENYRGFANSLLLLAGRFESRAILDLVSQYRQQASQG